ncbi:ABC transporter permease [Aporhodopirellula aestuarii]|uniref:ABC transporter permease n=1 Tax=Aporhodopirellula aestuarii TaxID=2950107 RepID=A0ABT0U649_9BACT|nr:ABC transporter permease [Aporhodopirellula aestuarii]MCM2372321.1 ABC transporter permease [Aporhodopirellula aestuarii]
MSIRLMKTAVATLAFCVMAGCQLSQPTEKMLPIRWIRIEVAEGQQDSDAILTERDFNEFRASIPTAQKAVPERRTDAAISIGDTTRQVQICATLLDAQDLLTDARAELSSGRFFSIEDAKNSHAVIVISQTMADELFAGAEAIGKTVLLNNREFKIIGVVGKPKVTRHGVALADIYMDLNPHLEPSTIQPVPSPGDLPPTLPLDRIWIKVGDLGEVTPTKKIIRNVLARNHPGIQYSILAEHDMVLGQ